MSSGSAAHSGAGIDMSSNQNYPGAPGGGAQSVSLPANNQQGSASKNDNAAASAGQDGQFGSHVAGTGPQTTKGHQVGQMVSEADHAPEFNAKTLPAGSAPSDRTFQANPTDEVPVSASGGSTSAQDTIGGATSGDVHTGLGKPVQGQSSSELHSNTKIAGGLQNVGAGGVPSGADLGGSKADFSTAVPGASQKTTGETHKSGVSDMSGNNGNTTQLERGSASDESGRGQ